MIVPRQVRIALKQTTAPHLPTPRAENAFDQSREPPGTKPEGNKDQEVLSGFDQNVKKGEDKTPQFGNYDRYYGYRKPRQGSDTRLSVMDPAWFRQKRVLDIGCNIGLLTMEIAQRNSPAHVLGVDIDESLVRSAEASLKERCARWGSKAPQNISFKAENFLEAPDRPEQFDTILCLSVTKWIHFNWGDEGIKRLFAAVYRSLAPAGIFVLEPQQWDSYKKKRALVTNFQEAFAKMELRPKAFTEYLLRTVGFAHCETLEPPAPLQQKRFHRPVHVFWKSTPTPEALAWVHERQKQLAEAKLKKGAKEETKTKKQDGPNEEDAVGERKPQQEHKPDEDVPKKDKKHKKKKKNDQEQQVAETEPSHEIERIEENGATTPQPKHENMKKEKKEKKHKKKKRKRDEVSSHEADEAEKQDEAETPETPEEPAPDGNKKKKKKQKKQKEHHSVEKPTELQE